MKFFRIFILFLPFAGFFCGSSGGGSSPGGDSSGNPSGDPVVSHKITYYANTGGGAVPVDNNTYLPGASATILNNTGGLSKAGQNFRGWNTLANGSGTIRSPGEIFSMGSQNVDLYAQWGAPMTITYSGNGNNGGSVPVDAATYVTGTNATILGNTGTLTKTSATFIFWNSAANGSGINLLPGASYLVPAFNPTIYASWLSDFTTHAPSEGADWHVAYANNIFVAVGPGSNGHAMSSPNGITWTSRTPVGVASWRGVAYGNGTFVAVSDSGANRVMTSPDGMAWTGRNAVAANSWYSVVFANGLFVAVSAGAAADRVMTSPDGINWTGRTAPSGDWYALAFGNGKFVAIAYSGTNRVMTSPDGINWTAQTAAENNSWQSVTYGNGLFVATSSDGTNRVMTSPDGITWTARSVPARNWLSAAYGNGLFLAVAWDSTSSVMISSDGINWTTKSAPANFYVAATYGAGVFLALQNNGVSRAVWQ